MQTLRGGNRAMWIPRVFEMLTSIRIVAAQSWRIWRVKNWIAFCEWNDRQNGGIAMGHKITANRAIYIWKHFHFSNPTLVLRLDHSTDRIFMGNYTMRPHEATSLPIFPLAVEFSFSRSFPDCSKHLAVRAHQTTEEKKTRNHESVAFAPCDCILCDCESDLLLSRLFGCIENGSTLLLPSVSVTPAIVLAWWNRY